MRSYALVALLAGAAIATPVPQDLDWDAIDDLDPVPTASIPIVDAAAAQTTLTFSATLAASSVSSAVLADPTDTSLKMVKRDNSACAVQPTSDDTSDAFLANAAIQSAALNAATPAGYDLIYANQTGSSQGVYGYMGYSVLNSYSTQQCANNCQNIVGCMSFNLCMFTSMSNVFMLLTETIRR